MEQYLARVPGGLDAYPSARAKASVLRNVLDGQRVEELAAALPPTLATLATDPPIGSEWMPEVRFVAILHAVADLRDMTDAAALAWARERNLALFRAPAYAILMSAASPAAMLRAAGRRWNAFHRGTDLLVDGASDDGVRLTLRFPPALFDAFALRQFCGAFLATLELSNARSPSVELEAEERGFARYVARW